MRNSFIPPSATLARSAILVPSTCIRISADGVAARQSCSSQALVRSAQRCLDGRSRRLRLTEFLPWPGEHGSASRFVRRPCLVADLLVSSRYLDFDKHHDVAVWACLTMTKSGIMRLGETTVTSLTEFRRNPLPYAKPVQVQLAHTSASGYHLQIPLPW